MFHPITITLGSHSVEIILLLSLFLLTLVALLGFSAGKKSEKGKVLAEKEAEKEARHEQQLAKNDADIKETLAKVPVRVVYDRDTGCYGIGLKKECDEKTWEPRPRFMIFLTKDGYAEFFMNKQDKPFEEIGEGTISKKLERYMLEAVDALGTVSNWDAYVNGIIDRVLHNKGHLHQSILRFIDADFPDAEFKHKRPDPLEYRHTHVD